MPPRLKPTRIEYVVDAERLRVQLTTAALDAIGDEAEQRRRALEVLRAALFRGRMIAKERLEEGAGGIETVRLLAAITDEVIQALYDFTTVHIFRARNPTEGERLTVMAVGGYGRGALAPFSDIDLLFLRPYKQTAHAESVIEYMLYALWDLGFKVGHASRTVDECIKLAREDFTIRTALLEARFLAGDGKLGEELKRRFRKDLQEGTAAEFVAAKLKERDERHARAGASRYLVEPNVKEGKGALRDLNTLFWIAQYIHPAEGPSEIVHLEEFTPREVRTFLRAFDFFWAVRSHLHYATGRPEERLSFDLQPEIARRMGYGDRGDTPAVERFMRRYFLTAKEVGALTRTFCAKLEAEQAKKPSGISRFLQRAPTRKALGAGFFEDAGRLNVEPAILAEDPVNLLRLFKVADQQGLDLHPDAFAAVTRALPLVTSKVRRHPAAAKAFLDILARGKHTYRTLTLMNESGLLGRFLPEFGRIVAQMQFNMYHSYTVDEHTLRAVGVIADIAGGQLKEDHPLAVSVMPLIEDREALFLAMLLHDTGKGGEGGQELAGARSARSACERLGLSPERTALVAWLVEHHLVMSDFAQKRDVGDPKTISAFVRIVENPERMRLLLVLTVADIRAVGPGVWNGWKGQLMRELYTSAEAVFRGGRSGLDPAAHFRADQRAAALSARDRFFAIAGDTPEAKAWAGEMEDAYFTAFTPEEIAAHYALAQRATAEDGAAAQGRVQASVSEIAVVARDRQGLFGELAATMAGFGANVVGARVYTSAAGQALDVFQVQDVSGGPLGAANPGALDRLTDAMAATARGEAPRFEVRKGADLGRAAAFNVTPSVAVDNDASDQATVVEVSGRDRPGLLEALTRTMANAGLSISSAHIDGYGERAVDAFYVVQADGGKLKDPKRTTALKAALHEVLAEGDKGAGKLRMQRARASVAR
jgi:[protein-PII] uridylyltransferase